jgi:hypothetical protein
LKYIEQTPTYMFVCSYICIYFKSILQIVLGWHLYIWFIYILIVFLFFFFFLFFFGGVLGVDLRTQGFDLAKQCFASWAKPLVLFCLLPRSRFLKFYLYNCFNQNLTSIYCITVSMDSDYFYYFSLLVLSEWIPTCTNTKCWGLNPGLVQMLGKCSIELHPQLWLLNFWLNNFSHLNWWGAISVIEFLLL